ncbi:MAG: CapA family protein [Ruminococcus sp.]|nr:CapA family protein [Ruminococcus sp.]
MIKKVIAVMFASLFLLPFGVSAAQNGEGEKAPQTIVISFAGDCTLGGDIQSFGEARFAGVAEKEGYAYFLKNVEPIFSADDYTVVNLETVLTTSEKKRANRSFIFRGKPEYAKILTLGGVEAVTIANNHANDFLDVGKADTKKALNAEKISYFGYEKETYITIKGVRFGFIGLTEWDYTAEEVKERVEAAKKNCDMLIVEFHWGIERQYSPSKTQQILGRAAVDAGADLVVGQHPHVLGETENYNGVNIVYSLGNFCYGGHSNPSDKDTAIFQQEFINDNGRVTLGDSRMIPCTLSSVSFTNDFCPTPKEEISEK